MNKLIKSTTSLVMLVLASVLFGCEDEGEKIVGLDGAAKYGYIKATFTGTRPDGEPFTATNSYQFLAENNAEYSNVSTDGFDYFYVRRLFGGVNEGHNNNYFDFNLSADGNTPQDNNLFNVDTYILTGDQTYVNLSSTYGFQASDITVFNYDEETGKLNLQYTVTISGDSNPTGNEITIRVKASVTVFRANIVG